MSPHDVGLSTSTVAPCAVDVGSGFTVQSGWADVDVFSFLQVLNFSNFTNSL